MTDVFTEYKPVIPNVMVLSGDQLKTAGKSNILWEKIVEISLHFNFTCTVPEDPFKEPPMVLPHTKAPPSVESPTIRNLLRKYVQKHHNLKRLFCCNKSSDCHFRPTTVKDFGQQLILQPIAGSIPAGTILLTSNGQPLLLQVRKPIAMMHPLQYSIGLISFCFV